ncbi:Small, acid-soluble spore protein gamma-type [Anoxybacillus sp. BCO1]|nr:Small, acid-soluble spore protein gamma-type [Anoxybacillus sp. BCO1]
MMKPNKTVAGTNIQHVKQQNAGQYGTEFSTETDVQHVKQQNAKAEAKEKSITGKGHRFSSDALFLHCLLTV